MIGLAYKNRKNFVIFALVIPLFRIMKAHTYTLQEVNDAATERAFSICPAESMQETATGSAPSRSRSARSSIPPATTCSPTARRFAGSPATSRARRWAASRPSTTASRPRSRSSPRAAAASSRRSTTRRWPTSSSTPPGCGSRAGAWRRWTDPSTSAPATRGGACW